MSTFDKLQGSEKARLLSRAKFNIKYQGILGKLFIIIGIVILIFELINGNFIGAIFSFLILFIIGKLFLFAYKKNLEFLIKYKGLDKSQLELAKNYWKSLINVFKN